MQFFIWPRTKFTPAKRLLPIILIHTVFCRAVESGTDFTPKLISNPEIREKVQSTGYGITAVTPTKVRNKLGGNEEKREKEKKKHSKTGVASSHLCSATLKMCHRLAWQCSTTVRYFFK